jgi:hypothetical protein
MKPDDQERRLKAICRGDRQRRLWAIFSLGEIDPMFGDQPDLVAYADSGGQLDPDGEDGFARIVVPGGTAGDAISRTWSRLRSSPRRPFRSLRPGCCSLGRCPSWRSCGAAGARPRAGRRPTDRTCRARHSRRIKAPLEVLCRRRMALGRQLRLHKRGT